MSQPKKSMFEPGARCGPGKAYTVVRLLGAGGMGEVFEVERDGRRYAYKALQFRHQHNKVVQEKFRAEAAAGREIARRCESGAVRAG